MIMIKHANGMCRRSTDTTRSDSGFPWQAKPHPTCLKCPCAACDCINACALTALKRMYGKVNCNMHIVVVHSPLTGHWPIRSTNSYMHLFSCTIGRIHNIFIILCDFFFFFVYNYMYISLASGDSPSMRSILLAFVCLENICAQRTTFKCTNVQT